MDRRRLLAATYGHLSIDIINSSVAMILVVVAAQWELSISQIGFGAMVYQLFAAMSQPLFGSITDRLGGRWVGAIGLLWTLIFYSLASLSTSYSLFISALMVGGLGSGAFHAAGLLNASVSGGRKPATATSIFFVGGQVGLALGPIIVGILLGIMGLRSMPWLALSMLPAVVLMLVFMNDKLPEAPKRKPSSSATQVAARSQLATGVLVTAFILFITFRSGTSQSFSTLLPKFYDDLGYLSSQYGLMLGLFAFSGAIGTLVGGFLGDRFSRRAILLLSPILSVPFSWMMLHTTGTPFIIGSILAGFLLSMPHSIVLVLSQELAPGRRGLMGGLVLGFMFASGSAVAWLASIAADSWGLSNALSFLAFMPFFAGLVTLLMPTRGAVVVEHADPVDHAGEFSSAAAALATDLPAPLATAQVATYSAD